ncbi:metacaspase-2-like [Pieris brassicae]|uniref:metacaspase-2-like n=1 Tax=Pieris brassicae TaxID=7116 RepID=UPI001E661CB6|nr:metacaspase-2-like [Pieris brassicae]
MHRILIVLILLKSVIAEDDSDERYIDALPEEEKREFLEKIARRIFEDYQNSNVPKLSSVNISDEALDSHTAYVQNILKEERSNTKKAIMRRDSQDYTPKSKEYERNKSENEKFLDLTMRASKREKRRNVPNENHRNNDIFIPVVPLYDNSDSQKPDMNNVQVQSINKSELLGTGATYKQHGDNYESSSISLRHSFIYDDSEDFDNHKSTIIDHFEPSSRDNNEKSSEETIQEESKSLFENNTTDDTVTYTTTDNIINLRKTINDETSPFQSPNENETIELKSVENFSKMNASIEFKTDKTINNDYSEVTLKPHSITFDKNILDIIQENPALVRNKTVLDGSVSVKTNPSVGHSAKNVMINQSELFSVSNITEEDLYNTTKAVVTDIPDFKTEIVVTVKPNTRNGSFDVTDDNNEQYRARKTYPKQKVEENRHFINNGDKITSWESKSRENKSVYYVYEVSAERPPFVATKSQKDNEHPHYAPVYNYSPENAYYNPYNRFGPNENDMDSDESQEQFRNKKTILKQNQRSRFKNINNNYYNPYKLNLYNILKHKKPYNMMVPQPVIPNSNNYNPNDYIDMDYFFGRDNNYMRQGKFNVNNLPDTNESDHPYTSYHKSGTMNYIDAVKKLLYAKKMFGYVPSVNETRQRLRHPKTLRDNLHDIFNIDNSKDKDDISIDYYFGRQNSHEEIDKFNNQHNMHHQFHSMTPTPLKRKKLKIKSKTNADIGEKEIDLVESTFTVIKDFIKMNNDALVNYDWLRTTVDVQTALEKLYDLTEALNASEHLHRYDLELLKYVVYLHKSSDLALNDTISLTSLQTTLNELRKNIKKKSLVPKIYKKRKGFKSAVKMWREFATFLRSLMQSKKDFLNNFQRLLVEVQFFLNDFHDAIKHVAFITTYKSQNWYTDLKNLYFRHADRRKILTILLHLSTSKLFDLIEDTKDLLGDSFLSFVKNNKKDVVKARNEFVYILKLLSELRKIN